MNTTTPSHIAGTLPATVTRRINRHGSVNSVIFLSFISAVAFAQTNGISALPSLYRTPLSDMVYDDNEQWRITNEQENPWRTDEKNILHKPRDKARFFPEYDYQTVDDPTSRSLLQNEYELERPRTNIFKYTF